jgi:predicted DNA-binding transcriptional regulator AlpA
MVETLTLEELLSRLPDRDFVTTAEVQHATGDVHVQTVYRWVQLGKLPSPKRLATRGRKSVYPREAVEKLIRSRFEPQSGERDEDRRRGVPRGAARGDRSRRT